MFTTDKMVNPFLKQRPIFGTNNYSQPSYTTTNTYNNYQPSDINSYKHQYRVSPIKASQAYAPNKYGQQKYNLGQILNKNPFTRPAPFISPSYNSQYALNKESLPQPKNPFSISSYEEISKNYIKSNEYNPTYTSTTSSRLTPPKRYDNYLSTSSADSTGTYINKIYELDEDRYSSHEAISNPFHRKSLISQKPKALQTKIKAQYGNYAAQYLRPERDYGVEVPRFRENNFVRHEQYEFDKKSGYGYGESDRLGKPDAVIGSQDNKYDDLIYKKGKYQQKYHVSSDPNDKGYKGNPFISKTNEDPYSKYKYDPNSNTSKNQASSYKQFKEYKDYPFQQQEPSFNYNYQSKKAVPRQLDSHNMQPHEDHPNKYDQAFGYGYDRQNVEFQRVSLNSKAKKSGADKYGLENSQRFDFGEQKDGFGQDENDLFLKKLKENKIESKINFNSEQSSYNQSKRHANNENEYPQNGFETLGGKRNPYQDSDYRKYKKQYNNEGKQYNNEYVSSKKLISSQVQQYNQKKRSKDAQTRLPSKKQVENKVRSSNKIMTFTENEQANAYDSLRNKAPVRDSRPEEYPRVLQLNGIIFHRVDMK